MKKVFFILFVFMVNLLFANSTQEQNLWKLLKQDNYFAMIRHAYAPGFGDPSNFDVNIKSTQRNLNSTGKKQASNIGKLFKKNGINEAKIYSSYWYRCYDTAVLLDLGKVEKFEGLNSFFEEHYDENKAVKKLKTFLKEKKFNKPLVLVTHQVNITNLTNYYPDSGEIVIVKTATDNSFKVIGTIKTLN